MFSLARIASQVRSLKAHFVQDWLPVVSSGLCQPSSITQMLNGILLRPEILNEVDYGALFPLSALSTTRPGWKWNSFLLANEGKSVSSILGQMLHNPAMNEMWKGRRKKCQFKRAREAESGFHMCGLSYDSTSVRLAGIPRTPYNPTCTLVNADVPTRPSFLQQARDTRPSIYRSLRESFLLGTDSLILESRSLSSD